jgi:hypothetical protein
LGQRLGGAHHGRGSDGLVGRDEDEALDPRLPCDLGDDPGGERVVAHRLDGVGLHQADVLVGRSVEDDRWSLLGEYLAHPLALLAVGQYGGQHRAGYVALVFELPLDREEVVLGVVEQDYAVGLDSGDLAAELRADRAARARDQHDLTGQIGADALELHVHGLAAQDVLDAHLAHLPGERAACLEQLEDRWQCPDRDASLAALTHDSGSRRARCGGDRDDHFVGLGVVEDPWQILAGVAPHPHAVDPQAQLQGIVVEEADGQETELAVAQDLPHDHSPSVPGARDQDRALTLPARAEAGQRATVVDRPRDRTDADQEDERQQCVDDHHAVGQADSERVTLGIAMHRAEDLDRDHGEQHDQHDRAHHRLVVALPGVAPAALVDA